MMKGQAMPHYQAPVQDTMFLLNDVFAIERYGNLAGFSDLTPDVLEAILREIDKFAREEILPLNLNGDRQGCSLKDGVVTTPDGYRQAYQLFIEGGWAGLSAEAEYGGQGLPHVLTTIMDEWLGSASMAWSLYPTLTFGAYAAIRAHGSDEIRARYLPMMAAGKWTGTMNLTEAHCGTDLGLLRTRAQPNDDGSYAITGTKIFISAGEHDLAENIIHLVLARIDGAPEGTDGISLFIVPKFLVGKDHTPGERNKLECGALEEKMGLHGSATCVMNFDGATGWLLGEENRGLRAMFTMMNEARLGVGAQGLSVSEVAYQNAAAYARERLQGRALTGPKEPDKPADPIIVHPDVRRMLMSIRSFNEAARALVVWGGIQNDLSRLASEESERQAAGDLLALLTPVIKGVLTDRGFDNAVMAQQVFGGHGYIAEWGMEQFVRDGRIPMIYEGANGVQALDLVGRKLARKGGKPVMAFFQKVDTFIAGNETDAMKPFVEPLARGRKDLEAATMWFMKNAMSAPDHAGAGSNDYMHLFGTVVLGYMWARMAKVAMEKRDRSDDTAYFDTKLTLARFYMERMMPETALRLTRISAGADTMMSLDAEAF